MILIKIIQLVSIVLCVWLLARLLSNALRRPTSRHRGHRSNRKKVEARVLSEDEVD